MKHDLNRFLLAQRDVYAAALSEIRAGRKRSHWMWFIFPQLKGLGYSSNAMYYGLEGLEEAAAYLADPVLGTRLREISMALLGLPGNDATAVMGSPDDLKLRSCMTLFARVPDADPVFKAVIDRYFGGKPDAKTLALLG